MKWASSVRDPLCFLKYSSVFTVRKQKNVRTGSWRCEQPQVQRRAGPPTSESHPGKPAACWCGYLAAGWSCHLLLEETKNKTDC